MTGIYNNYYQHNTNTTANPVKDQSLPDATVEQSYVLGMEMLEEIGQPESTSPEIPSIDPELQEPLPEVKVEHPGKKQNKKKAKNNDSHLSDSQKRLKHRFVDNKKDVRREFKEIQQKLKGINKLDAEAQVKSLRELDSLILDLEAKDNQLEILEDTAQGTGLKIRSNLTEKIEKLKGNVEVKLDQAKDKKAVETQSKIEQTVEENNKKIQEENKKLEKEKLKVLGREARDAINEARDTIGRDFPHSGKYDTLNGNSKRVDSFTVETKKLLFLMSDAAANQKWDQVIAKIDELVNSDNNMSDDILAGVGLVLMTELSTEHLKIFPENVIKKLIDGISSGDKPHLELIQCAQKPESDFVVDFLKSENSGFVAFFFGKDTHYRVTGLNVAEGLQRLSDLISGEEEKAQG